MRSRPEAVFDTPMACQPSRPAAQCSIEASPSSHSYDERGLPRGQREASRVQRDSGGQAGRLGLHGLAQLGSPPPRNWGRGHRPRTPARRCPLLSRRPRGAHTASSGRHKH
eukprot:1422756-Pyramimonas_sp.AAC.1